MSVLRAIDEATYTAVIKTFMADEKVALFQKLLLLPKIEPAAAEPAEKKEVVKNGDK